MTDALRVLWLTKGLGRGGAERLLVSSAQLHDRSRFQIDVAYVLPWKDALVADLERLGVPVHCLSRAQGRDPRWPLRLRSLIRERRIDVVHTHLPLTAAVARVVAPRGVTFVHTEHNVWERHHPLTRAVNRCTLGRNAAVLAVSQAVADSIGRRRVGFGRPPTTVVLHGPDVASALDATTHRSGARRLLGIEESCQVIGTVGNFTAKKDQRTLVDAFAELRRRNVAARLVLVGTGPLEDTLRAYVAELGLAEVVTFAGSRGDVAQVLPAFDVFCLSSRYEGLSIALLEAMASGIACVCTRAGGVVEVIDDDRSGVLVPPADPPALADALDAVLRDDVLRRSLAEAAQVRSASFDLQKAVRTVESVYDSVATRRPRGPVT